MSHSLKLLTPSASEGLVRVSVGCSDFEQALPRFGFGSIKANGAHWFVDLVGDARNAAPEDVGVQWVPWAADESTMITRVADQAKLGVVLGRGLGTRMRRADPAFILSSAVWRMRGIPQAHDVANLAAGMGFEAVEITARHRTRKGHDWCFRATRQDRLHVVSQAVQRDPESPETTEVVVLKESARRGARTPVAQEAIGEPRTVTFGDLVKAQDGGAARRRVYSCAV